MEPQTSFRNGFFPDREGWEHTLPDGVVTHIRLRETSNGNFEPEWLLAKRDIKIPAEYDPVVQAEKMASMFMQSHRNVRMSEDAEKRFTSYQTYFNISVFQAREVSDIDGGATLGICPWKLGMLSAALGLWDILWDQREGCVYEEKNEGQERQKDIVITGDVIDRGFGLLELLLSVERMLARKIADGTSSFSDAKGIPKEQPDFDFDPACLDAKLKDSMVARRLLERLSPVQGTVGTYKVHKGQMYKLTSKQESTDGTKYGGADFKALGLRLTRALGSMNPQADEITIVFPPDDADPELKQTFASDLQQFANTSPAALLKTIERRNNDKRGREQDGGTSAGRSAIKSKRHKGNEE